MRSILGITTPLETTLLLDLCNFFNWLFSPQYISCILGNLGESFFLIYITYHKKKNRIAINGGNRIEEISAWTIFLGFISLLWYQNDARRLILAVCRERGSRERGYHDDARRLIFAFSRERDREVEKEREITP